MNQEQQAGLRILAHVVRADARVCGEELLALDALAERNGALSRLQILDDRTELDALVRAVVSPELQRRTLVEAVALANVDGRCAPEELAVLARIRHGFEADAWFDLASESAAWRRRTRTLRLALEEATVAYLHKVQDAAAHDELTMDRYERLAGELLHTKAELQRAFLDAVDQAEDQAATPTAS